MQSKPVSYDQRYKQHHFIGPMFHTFVNPVTNEKIATIRIYKNYYIHVPHYLQLYNNKSYGLL